VVSENFLVQCELVKSGGALGLLIDSIGDKEPLVERVLSTTDEINFPIWLVAHQLLKSSKRMRVVFDILAESLLTG